MIQIQWVGSSGYFFLMGKGILGKYKDGYSYYFTTPMEAVIVKA
jgi:hypothetical protein